MQYFNLPIVTSSNQSVISNTLTSLYLMGLIILPLDVEVSVQLHILSYDLTVTSCFPDGECGNVAMFGFTCPGAFRAINLLCVF